MNLLRTWKYYNHAMIPATAPHKSVDEGELQKKSFWRNNKGALLARWTTAFDCGYETNWWYVIKDKPFDIAELKAKRRYEVNRGIKNFDVKLIDPTRYIEELYLIQIAAFSAYPEKYRPSVNEKEFKESIKKWKSFTVFGAFHRDTGMMVGYAYLAQKAADFVNFSVLKTNPEYEKLGLNAALVEKILAHYQNFLSDGGIICDGARSINHETSFQDYLEKYFNFRKAYCKLHIKYNPLFRWIVRLLYPMRKILLRLDSIGMAHSMNAILKMEEIYREG